MNYIFITVFAISSIIHLYASFKCNQRLRAFSKPLIIISLLGFYLSISEKPITTLCLALVFSWLGDILLIPKSLKLFVAGGSCFITSHFLFIATYIPFLDFSVIPIWLIVIVALIYIIFTFYTTYTLKQYIHKPLHIPMFLYLLMNGLNNCFAFFMLLSKPCIATAVVFFGTTFFYVSDSILYHVRFKTTTHWKSHFPVMLTYILATSFITMGMYMLVG